MDWSMARFILIVAFGLLNALLSFSIWGPGGHSYNLSGRISTSQYQQLKATLFDRGLDLRASLPRTPEPLPFLHVGYVATDEYLERLAEPSGMWNQLGRLPLGKFSGTQPYRDSDTEAVVIPLNAQGEAGFRVDTTNLGALQRRVENFLQTYEIFPVGATLLEMVQLPDGRVRMEYVPYFHGHPVFSGYLRVLVSERGIEEISYFWVEPQGFRETSTKPIRPPSEALLRLAGHLQNQPTAGRRIVTDVRFGYYAGAIHSSIRLETSRAWETVPTWRIRLDTGEVFYINAFNGELEF